MNARLETKARAPAVRSRPSSGRVRGASVVLAAVGLLAGCVVNPVTGDRELALVSADQEVSIGEQQYLPSRQMQGGELVAFPDVIGYVSSVGQRLAEVSDRALPYEFTVLNNSTPNAWALPGGKIAINRGLLVELESEAELAAVLGHEIVHAAARHGAQAMQRGILIQGAVLATAAATRDGDYSNLAVGAAGLGAQLINQSYGRGAELEADRYGMRYMSEAGYDPEAAVSLQQTFVRLSEGQSDQGWVAGLFASHPPSAERVEQNRETASNLPDGGTIGRERYRTELAPLVDTEAAYAAYDRARTALTEGRVDEAAALAEQAVEGAPGEGHFRALLGAIDVERGRSDAALAHYDAAIARNDAYFRYPLEAGWVHLEAGRLDEAENDLARSAELLPTADALLGLGRIAERRGNRSAAVEHYSAAAQSSSDAGRAAQEALARLDLPEQPGEYLSLRTGLDSAGRLQVEISNPTQLAVTEVVLVIRYSDSGGAVREITRGAGGPIAAGSSRVVATGLGPFSSAEAYDVAIGSAQIANP